jgi:uncharacterized protein (DUF2236 family)
MNPLKAQILADHAAQIGSHDQPEVFAEPAGDPGLMGPGSVSWKVNGDIGSVTLAGVAAIGLELLHPSVMAGVGQQSSYREDPFRRARTTFGWVITTTFGSTAAAEALIARVKRMHARVNGVRPDDGVPYSALDPELIAWVHTAIPWMAMTAYERFAGPLTTAEKDSYLAEQSVVALKSGAEEVPVTVSELEAYVEQMRPKLRSTELLREFFEFLVDGPLGALRGLGPLERPAKRFQVASGMSLAPRWAQEMTGWDRSRAEQRLAHAPSMHTYARLLRWAYGTPPWVRLARERTGDQASSIVSMPSSAATSSTARSPVAIESPGPALASKMQSASEMSRSRSW